MSEQATSQQVLSEQVLSEQARIGAVIERYIEAGVAGDSALMSTSFHDDATIYAVNGDGAAEGGPIQILFDAVEGQPAPKLTGELGPIDVNGTTATARVVLSDWAGADYTDQFTLLKTADDWKILSKVYHDRNRA